MSFLEKAWYSSATWLHLLKPISALYGLGVSKRKQDFLSGKKPSYRPSVPVVVVGNITVGGTGKTPLVIYLAQLFHEAGYKTGIVSRGYKGSARNYPLLVNDDTPVQTCGDEAKLLARNCPCPVIIDPDRSQAVARLEQEFACDLIISDDGLQHYALQRDIEIAVIDGARGLGNGMLLPAGPLRENEQRLLEVDFVISNGPVFPVAGMQPLTMEMSAVEFINLKTGATRSFMEWFSLGKGVPSFHVVAGIGNPQRFFDSLSHTGFAIIEHPFRDHYYYNKTDLEFGDDLPVIMTEKDAVKCSAFASENHWYVKAQAILPDYFKETILGKVQELTHKQVED